MGKSGDRDHQKVGVIEAVNTICVGLTTAKCGVASAVVKARILLGSWSVHHDRFNSHEGMLWLFYYALRRLE